MKKYKNIIIIAVLAVIIVGYYFYLANRPIEKADKPVEVTEIQKVLDYSIESATKTPRECVKFYSNIIKCFYNEKPTDDDIVNLGAKARELFDDELLANNENSIYLGDLKKDIDLYATKKKIVMSYAVESGSDVEYYTTDGLEYAIVNASYTLRETEVFEKTNEEYILRKDDQGQWKILGWRLAAESVVEEENE